MSYYNKLIDAGIKLSKTSGQEKTFCPKCHQERKNKRDRSLSVNISDGSYNCHNCGWNGNVREFERKKEFKKLGKEFIPKDSKPRQQIVSWFAGRKISERTMNKFLIYQKVEFMPQVQGNANCICFPYFKDAELVNVKYRDGQKNFKMVTGAELVMYNLPSVVGRKKAIVVEGEIDCLSLFECGFSDDEIDQKLRDLVQPLIDKKTAELEQENEEAIKKKRVPPHDLKNNPVTIHDVDIDNAELQELLFLSGWAILSVPNGASKGNAKLDYLENCADDLLHIEEFVIATDGDAAGMQLRDELVRRFGVEKCRVARYPDHYTYLKDGVRVKCKDFNDILIHYGKKSIQDIVRNAENIPVDGIYSVEDIFHSMLEKFRHGIKLGDTTRFDCLDNNFRWKRGELNLGAGYGNHGKTTFFLQLMLTKSIYDGWKWGVFSPENYPADDFFDDLVEMFVGKWIDNSTGNGMSEEEYIAALEFIKEHFFYVYPEADHSLQTIHSKFRYLILKKGIDGILIDPWNQLDHVQKSYQREDQYLSEQFTVCKRFALSNGIIYNIIAHPSKPSYGEGKQLPVVDMYDMAGGAMWGNKMDNIISYYRPDWHFDKTSPNVEIHIQKIKRRRTGGEPGMVQMKYVWSKKRFCDLFDQTPCDPILAKRIRENEEKGLLPAAIQRPIDFVQNRTPEEAHQRFQFKSAASKADLATTDGDIIDDLPF